MLELGDHSKEDLCLTHKFAPLENLTVIHTTGIQDITVHYCTCQHASHHRIQLLWAHLWPATITNPQTAVTFDCLKHFQMLNLMTKTSGSEFYKTLEHLTDNTGMRVPPVSSHALFVSFGIINMLKQSQLQEFIHCTHEWRTVCLYKRHGHGLIPGRCKNLSMGDLAVDCVACPYPGVNLPSEYEVHPSKWFVHLLSSLSAICNMASLFPSFIYKLFTAQDANMKCTRLNASSEQRDPGFNIGCAYFINQPDFMDHIHRFDKRLPETKPTCNDHKAIHDANSRWERNLMAQGVASIFCARHDCFHAGSTCDLWYGEQYVHPSSIAAPGS